MEKSLESELKEWRRTLQGKALRIWKDKVESSVELDAWQQEVYNHKGNITLRAGRQVGKSFIISWKGGKFCIEHAGTTTLIIAAAQRQSSHLFEKILGYLRLINEEIVNEAKKRYGSIWEKAKHRRDRINLFYMDYGIFEEAPTKTRAKLRWNSVIYSLPAGKSGVYIRCFTIDLLIGDEAAYISDLVWTAVRPMLAVSMKEKNLGWTILLSTPFGKGGFFYDSFHDNSFRQWHINSETCRRLPSEYFRKERQRMSKVEYAQEIMGEFVDEFNQLFPTNLIRQRMTFISWDGKMHHDRRYYLGVDVARYGGDLNAFVIAEMRREGSQDKVRVIYASTTERKGITDTCGRIKALHDSFHFSKIFIDSSGVGGGLYDMLAEDRAIKRILVGLENARRTIDKNGRTGKLFKEDLYSNAIVLMEREPPLIDIISDLELLRSLKSMTFEYTADRNLKIFGKCSHLSEAFVRACWCVKSKGLNLFIA